METIMTDLAQLNSQFAIPGHLTFAEGPGGMPIARISNSLATSDIALQGAHLMTFQPKGEAPVVWLSAHSRFAPGKSIRGGIPICWPWFGAHADNASFPAHGFARTVHWDVVASAALPDGATRITFELAQNDATRAQWPHSSRVRNIVTVGRVLTVELVTENLGGKAFELGEALHTYIAVSDLDNMSITGLEGCTYIDKVDDGQRGVQNGAVTVTSEVDRVYLDTVADCVVEDRGLQRRVRIAKSNSRSTVLWNPWIEKADKMGDFGGNDHRGMVCVESANAASNVVTVVPGETHTLRAVYSVEKL